ncbi:energy-coupling factor transporter transmembrane component T [Micromonospora sp. LOL_023]|uniref:energy-coupling factor transporter transmembrane component T n=1 Tax=Micromonospora sp. LOL_023 TaxID=3345418 RepID=UPI003A8AEBFC
MNLLEVRTPAGIIRSPGLDPRTKILLVVLVSTAVTSPGGLRFVPAALLIAVGLALWEGARHRALVLPITVAAMWVLGWLLPLWWPNPVTAIVSLVCTYLIRFVVAIGVGAHLIATTSPTELAAALRAAKAPRAISVTLAVMLRFFPVVVAESAAVRDAMRLRGLTGAGGFLRHPVLSLERFAVPMIASSLRASEDLSASAILRGLGSHRTPTAMHPPRLGRTDLVMTLLTAGVATAAVLLPAPLA